MLHRREVVPDLEGKSVTIMLQNIGSIFNYITYVLAIIAILSVLAAVLGLINGLFNSEESKQRRASERLEQNARQAQRERKTQGTRQIEIFNNALAQIKTDTMQQYLILLEVQGNYQKMVTCRIPKEKLSSTKFVVLEMKAVRQTEQHFLFEYTSSVYQLHETNLRSVILGGTCRAGSVDLGKIYEFTLTLGQKDEDIYMNGQVFSICPASLLVTSLSTSNPETFTEEVKSFTKIRAK